MGACIVAVGGVPARVSDRCMRMVRFKTLSGQASSEETLQFDWAVERVEEHIPKQSDRRAMGLQFQMGVVAADLALRLAEGANGKLERKEVGIYVATRPAERDDGLDEELIGSGVAQSDLNRAFMQRLRPTLFLAQLPNLLAGNISIVTSCTGTSRTFLGEESAGVSVIRCAIRDIEADRERYILVGGSINASNAAYQRWRWAALSEADTLEQRVCRAGLSASNSTFLLMSNSGEVVGRQGEGLVSIELAALGLIGEGANEPAELLSDVLARCEDEGCIVVCGGLEASCEMLRGLGSIISTESLFGDCGELLAIATVGLAATLVNDRLPSSYIDDVSHIRPARGKIAFAVVAANGYIAVFSLRSGG